MKRTSIFFYLLLCSTLCFSQNYSTQDSLFFNYCEQGIITPLKRMIDGGVDVNLKAKSGKTPLHIVCKSSQLDDYGAQRFIMEKLLLEKGASVNAQDSSGITPLMEVVLNSNNELALKLLFLYGADLNIKNNEGKTALDIAKQNHKILSVKLIESFLEQVDYPRKTMLTTYVSFDNDGKHLNNSFFEDEKEISKLLIHAASKGELQAYFFDNSIEKDQEQLLTAAEFLERIQLPEEAESDDFDEWEEENTTKVESDTKAYYFPFQLRLISLEEEVISNSTGKFSYYPKYISLYLPAAMNVVGFDKYLCSFRYQDCAKLFNTSQLAVWDNALDQSFGNVFHISSGSPKYSDLVTQLFGKQEDINQVGLSVNYKKINNSHFPDSIFLYETEDNLSYALSEGKSYNEVKKSLQNTAWLSGNLSLKIKYDKAIEKRVFIPYYGNEEADSVAKTLYTSFIEGNKSGMLKDSNEKHFAKLVYSDIPLNHPENQILSKSKKSFNKYLLKKIKKGKLIPLSNFKNIFNEDSVEQISKDELWERFITVSDENENSTLKKGKYDKAFLKYVNKRVQILGMVNEWTFDMKGDSLNHNPKYISLIIPALYYDIGINKTIAYFSYEQFLKAVKKKTFKQFFLEEEYLNIIWEASPVYEFRDN